MTYNLPADLSVAYWNGKRADVVAVRVIVGESPRPTWWCAKFAGQERAALRVDLRDGRDPFYIDDTPEARHKVTTGRGGPGCSHSSLPVDRELDPQEGVAQ